MSHQACSIQIDATCYKPINFLNEEPHGYFVKNIFFQEVYLFLNKWYNTDSHIRVSTSGSTGPPKEIRLLKELVFQQALKTCSIFKLTKESTALLCLPVDYIAGKLMLVRSIASGMNLLLQKPDSLPLRTLNKKVDFVAMTTLQLKKSLEFPDDLNKSNIILVGGAPLENSTHDLLNSFETRIYQSYGMTETATHVALRPLNHTEIIHPYTAIPGVTFSTDNRKCLLIHAPHISELPIVTNDIVELVDENHFYWKGRTDFVINTGGVKVFPEEIEQKLKHLLPFPFYISHQNDNDLGQKVVLVVEEKNFEMCKTLIKETGTLLGKFEKPRKIIKVKNIRYSESGKILREDSL